MAAFPGNEGGKGTTVPVAGATGRQRARDVTIITEITTWQRVDEEPGFYTANDLMD